MSCYEQLKKKHWWDHIWSTVSSSVLPSSGDTRTYCSAPREKDHKRTGASVIWGESVRAGTVLCRSYSCSIPVSRNPEKMPGGLHGWEGSFQQTQTQKMKHAEVKNREKTWGKYKDTGWTCRDAVRKVYLEINLAQNNKENFHKYASDKMKTRDNVSLLLSVPRDPVTQSIVKAEVLVTVFTWVSTSKTGLQQFQAQDTNGKILEHANVHLVEDDQARKYCCPW